MKKLVLMGAIILAAAVSNAASTSAYNYGSRGSGNVTGYLGFNQSAVSFGAQYENRMDTMGVGGYFHFATEKDNVGKDHTFTAHQTVSFGAIAPAHFLDDNRFDLYLAPGVGITMVKGIKNAFIDSDQTMFGPIWKIGALFKVTPTVRIGIERLEIVNWFTDKLPENVTYTDAAFAFSF